MRKNIFEMGANFEDGWSSDNKDKQIKSKTIELKLPNKHQLVTQKERRRGKVVTIVKEFFIQKDELKSLLKDLKKSLGCGGTIKDSSLEFQGDIATKLKVELKNREFKFKK